MVTRQGVKRVNSNRKDTELKEEAMLFRKGTQEEVSFTKEEFTRYACVDVKLNGVGSL
jgi:hypothetical protein